MSLHNMLSLVHVVGGSGPRVVLKLADTFEELTVSGKDSGATELKCTLLFCATVTGISLPFINQGQPKRANNLGIISNNISL